MGLVLSILFLAIDIFIYIMIAGVILSWLTAFNVANPDHPVIAKISKILYRVTEPVLSPIRRVIPPLGGIDISPIVVIIGASVIKQLIIRLYY